MNMDRLRVWWSNLKHWKTGRAVRDLTRAFRTDDGFVLTWKCTIACTLMDRTRLNHAEANEAADELMRTLFQVKPNAPRQTAERSGASLDAFVGRPVGKET